VTVGGETVATETLPEIPDLRRLYGKVVMTARMPRGESLPDHELVVADVSVDAERLAAYDAVCGYRLGDRLPPTYPHVLAFPLHVQLMTDRAFPLPVTGLLHLRNVITVRQPLLLGQPMTLRVRAQELARHPKGTTVTFVADAAVEEETVWSSCSTYLARGVEVPAAADLIEAASTDELPQHTAAVIRVPGDAGRRYAAVSGDVNPIHLHSLAARAFGFPRAIAHGMWSKASCLAALEGRLPDSCTIDVAFDKPVLLPAKARLLTASVDDGWDFALTSDDRSKVHLRGTVRRNV
jgi:hypothetical protein